MPLITRRALVLAKIEDTYNVDPTPDPTLDAVLVSDPDYTVDLNVLERNFVRDDLSPLGHVIGRKLAGLSFGCELRSNGSTNSGSVSDAPILGRLLRACGYAETGVATTGCVGAATANAANTGPATVFDASGGESTYTEHSNLTVTVVKGGASATAEVRVSGGDGTPDADILRSEAFTATTDSASGTVVVDDADPLAVTYTVAGSWVEGDIITFDVGGFTGTAVAPSTPTPTTVGDALDTAITALHADITGNNVTGVVTVTFANDMDGAVITSATTDFPLGNSGSTTQMTWTGSLVLGDSWTLIVSPKGVRYTPVSENFESVTLYAFFDGVRHILTGCYGTFTVNAEAGQYGTIDFTFTGQYVAPTDVAVPSNAVYETALPPQVELARLHIADFAAVVNAFTFDQGNTIAVRPDVNGTDGYNGTRIVGRDPTGGIDPEAELVATEDFWAKLAAATQMAFQMRVGTVAGNLVWITAPSVQYTGLTYGDRDGIRVYDAGLRFGRVTGDDEIEIAFG